MYTKCPDYRKANLFYVRTDLPSRVGRLGLFSLLFFLPGDKNDPKKHKNFEGGKKTDFLQTKFGKIFWSKFQQNFKDFGLKNDWFYNLDFRKIKTKISQNGKFGSVVPVKHFFFPWPKGLYGKHEWPSPFCVDQASSIENGVKLLSKWSFQAGP